MGLTPGRGGEHGKDRVPGGGSDMKVRIGVGAAGASSSTEALGDLVKGLDELGFDSLWLAEVLTGPVLDPVVGLAWAAASNPRLQIGATMRVAGRNGLRR